MIIRKTLGIILSLLLIFGLSLIAAAQQNKPSGGEGTITQRLDVLRSRLDGLRRSVGSAISAYKEETKDEKKDKKDKKDKTVNDTPLGRLKSLEKEITSLQSDVNSLRGKIDRSEKYDIADLEQIESTATELQDRTDKLLVETAGQRKAEYTVGEKREKKKKGKFLGIFGKGGDDEYEGLIGTVAPGRDRELFVEATKNIRKGRYEVGRLLFQTIITTYAESPYLPMAKLAIADSFFLEGGSSSNLIQAAASYQDWLTFFPTHPLADRVLLKVAESEMRQIGRPDRDASRARKAEQRLKALLQQYPKSELRDAAQERLNEVQDNLGLHNLWIGNFYYRKAIDQKKTGLKGAQSRYREILDKYPNFGWMDEALFRLANTYLVEEETDEAAKYFQRLVRDYPNSDYVEKSKEQLQILGASIPEPNPARADFASPEGKSFVGNFLEELTGSYGLTIDSDGVLMTKDFSKDKFDLIDSVIKNGGELPSNEIPKPVVRRKADDDRDKKAVDAKAKEDKKIAAETKP